jgi:hypothetical protein
MDTLSSLEIDSKEFFAEFTNKCNLQEMFETLSVDNRIIEITKFYPRLGGLCLIIKVVLNSGSKYKSIYLNPSSAQIRGCNDLREASEVLQVLNLEATDISELLVWSNFNIPNKVDFSQSPSFRMEQNGDVCILYHKTDYIRIKDNKVQIRSRCSEDALQAYNDFVNEFYADETAK